MAYVKLNWMDHAVARPRTYTEVTNPDGSKTLTPAPGTITQQGTPMSAANFNHMENGIAAAAEKVSGAVEHNFAGLDANGNIKDSGKNAANFFSTTPNATFISTDNKWDKIVSYVSPMLSVYGGQITEAFRVLVRTFNGINSGFGIFTIDIRNNGNQTYVCSLKTQIPLPTGTEIVALVTADATTLTVDIYMRMTTSVSTALVYSLGSFLAGGSFATIYRGTVNPSYTDLPAATATINPEMQVAGYSTLTLLNSFTGWIRYTKLASGMVVVRFSITPGTTTDGTQIALLPTAYRPLMACIFPLINNTSITPQNFRISTVTGYIYNVGALTAGVTYSGSFNFLAE